MPKPRTPQSATRPTRLMDQTESVRLQHLFADWLAIQPGVAYSLVTPLDEFRRYLAQHGVLRRHAKITKHTYTLGQHYDGTLLHSILLSKTRRPRNQLIMDIRTYKEPTIWQPHVFETREEAGLPPIPEPTARELYLEQERDRILFSKLDMRLFAMWLVEHLAPYHWKRPVSFKRLWNRWRKKDQGMLPAHSKVVRDIKEQLHPHHASALLALPSPIPVVELLLALGLDPELDLSLPRNAIDDIVEKYTGQIAIDRANTRWGRRERETFFIPPRIRESVEEPTP